MQIEQHKILTNGTKPYVLNLIACGILIETDTASTYTDVKRLAAPSRSPRARPSVLGTVVSPHLLSHANGFGRVDSELARLASPAPHPLPSGSPLPSDYWAGHSTKTEERGVQSRHLLAS